MEEFPPPACVSKCCLVSGAQVEATARCQVPFEARYQVSGVRCQKPCARCQKPGGSFQVPGGGCQVSGAGARCQVVGARWWVAGASVSLGGVRLEATFSIGHT